MEKLLNQLPRPVLDGDRGFLLGFQLSQLFLQRCPFRFDAPVEALEVHIRQKPV